MISVLAPDGLEDARALLAESCAYDPAALVAEEKLFGAAPPPHESVCLAAHEDHRLEGVAVVSGRWLRLIAVRPASRRKGLGSALLDAAAARARGWGATRLRSGDQAGNYLAPGIDERNQSLLAFLGKRGFREAARYENLAVPLVGNAKVTRERADALAAAAHTRRARPEDTPALLDFVATAFAPVWAFEVARALDNDPPGVHVAADAAGRIVAFACHDGNNRGLGWFGPAGTAPAERGRGLGQALLVACLVDVAAAGHAEGVIAWIGPRKFYEDAAGARLDRRFIVLEKGLA